MANSEKNSSIKYPGKRVTCNGNQLVLHAESLISDAGVFYPITPSTEQGEMFENLYAKGHLNAFGNSLMAFEAEGEHAAQGGAIAMSVTGKRVVNFTSGQGIVYGVEQYYHAPGKLSSMVVSVAARALTKHALNVHCGHDDVYAALDTGWIIAFAKDAQQAADHALILRKVCELSLNPGINVQDGFLTSHLDRSFYEVEPALVREFLGRADDVIDCPTQAQKTLFGPTRRRVAQMIDLKNPVLLGPVQNQEHYMNGVAARRNNFSEPILGFFESAYEEFAALTGRKYGLISTYNLEKAQTVFITLGCSAENLEAAVDYIRDTRGEEAGIVHVNVLRPFPERAVVEAIQGKKNVIILERTDEPLGPDNPLTRDVRVCLSKSIENFQTHAHPHLPKLNPATEKPFIFSGVYGLGSRDFRPEGMLGAYEFAMGRLARQDGKLATDGERFFFLGIDHPYAVETEETPSLLPEGARAVRFHSIGGWGMITTGKNLSEILLACSTNIAKKKNLYDEQGNLQELIHISANPKYGSEKKGSPTNYFLVAANQRVRVNCDLRHVTAVLCCDPKIFTHTNPLTGLSKGGNFVWESSETDPQKVWRRIPPKARKEIIEREIQIYVLSGFNIARNATNREDLQTRMQGNAFLGAFFKVSPFLQQNSISDEEFQTIVRGQYMKKFGRFGEAVVDSNMQVMQAGFDSVIKIEAQDLDAPDTSRFIGTLDLPCKTVSPEVVPANEEFLPMFTMEAFDAEYRAGLGYDQPSSPLASVGIIAAGSGKASGKYVARIQTPVYIAENCTQCMECISVCPDTALPNTAQDLETILKTAISHYVTDRGSKEILLSKVSEIEASTRTGMVSSVKAKEKVPFHEIISGEIARIREQDNAVTSDSLDQLSHILEILPLSFQKTKSTFELKEKKEPGSGGLFSIFVNDMCKGCAACVEACGDHMALKMVDETEDVYAHHLSSNEFLKLLPDTEQKYMGMFDAMDPAQSRAAALRNHLMMQSKYSAFVAGDGACAGCGEKSVLRSIATITETYMRPIFRAKAKRLREKAALLEEIGENALGQMREENTESYLLYVRAIQHLILGLGGTDEEDTKQRIRDEFQGSDEDLLKAVCAVLRQDAYNHDQLKTSQDTLENGMCVMAMAAHTGCQTVYGSTPPNNPHPYPWMNSLFQDGATIGWLIGESFIKTHSLRSVIPERLANVLLGTSIPLEDHSDSISIDPGLPEFSEDDYFRFSHFSDSYMTDSEIDELPKVWVVGGDGGMGDIGFQNVSKAVLQNRPNVKMVMLDTQVYSNTGGQNSEQSPMTGGFDMNQYGKASEGKLSEMKSVAQCFLSGHGSPFLAQVSMSNAANLYKNILDCLTYRGTAFLQSFTTCQPEHGVPDHAAQKQSRLIRDSRGMPEFVNNPQLGETYSDSLSLKGNPSTERDWYLKVVPGSKERYAYTSAHWAFTEARFRAHHKIIKKEEALKLIPLEEKLKLITMNDIVYRRHLDPEHRAYVPPVGVYVLDFLDDGTEVYHKVSRQMVLFCVERRKSWRLLQSRAGVHNKDYPRQKVLLEKVDKGEWSTKEAQQKTEADLDALL
jgi:pyruvate-ferredoxin/flavodoxin oxidoreductase